MPTCVCFNVTLKVKVIEWVLYGNWNSGHTDYCVWIWKQKHQQTTSSVENYSCFYAKKRMSPSYPPCTPIKFLQCLNCYWVDTKYCYETCKPKVRPWPWAENNDSFIMSYLKIPLGVKVLLRGLLYDLWAHDVTLTHNQSFMHPANGLNVVNTCSELFENPFQG